MKSVFAVMLFVQIAVSQTVPAFEVEGVSLAVPISGWNVDRMLDHSVLYLPRDAVRDGLPWYGSKRDDWIPGARQRKHMGLDIYGEPLTIIAAADGEVIGVGRGGNAGGNVRIMHKHGIQTMYLHLNEIIVWQGATVHAGDVIGYCREPDGNARETQLHFQIVKEKKHFDPIQYLLSDISEHPILKQKLNAYAAIRASRELERDSVVVEYLKIPHHSAKKSNSHE